MFVNLKIRTILSHEIFFQFSHLETNYQSMTRTLRDQRSSKDVYKYIFLGLNVDSWGYKIKLRDGDETCWFSVSLIEIPPSFETDGTFSLIKLMVTVCFHSPGGNITSVLLPLISARVRSIYHIGPPHLLTKTLDSSLTLGKSKLTTSILTSSDQKQKLAANKFWLMLTPTALFLTLRVWWTFLCF